MSALSRALALSSVLLLASFGLLAPSRAQVTRVAVPRDRWGVALSTDRPFYAVGDDVRVTWRLPNETPSDAFGIALMRGGNGCTYRVRIEDANGDTVWTPGSILGGQFLGPGCLFAETPWRLLAHSDTTFELTLPLVFQNGGGIGVLGAPLPAGFYRVTLEVRFHGPHEMQVSGSTAPGGLDHAANVPIQIR